MRETARTRRLKGGFALVLFLGALSALGPVSIDLSLPALPTIQRVLGMSNIEVQSTIATFMFAFAIGQLIVGPLADRFGRRPVALCGLAVFTFAGLACTFASGPVMLIAARAVQGFAACAATIVSRTAARDLSPDRTRAATLMGYVNAVHSAAPIIAPVLGGALIPLGWRSVYGFSPIVGVALFAAVATMLPETLQERSIDRITVLYKRFLLLPRSIPLVLVSFAACSGMFNFIGGAPFVLQQQLGVSVQMSALAVAISVGGLAIGTLAGGRFAARLGSERLLACGVVLLFAASMVNLAVNAFASASVPAFMLAMAVYVCAFGLLQPNLFAAVLQDAGTFAGTGVAVVGTAQVLGGMTGSVTLGIAHSITAFSVGEGAAVGGIVSLVAYGISRRRGALTETQTKAASEGVAIL